MLTTYETNGIHIFYSYSYNGKLIRYFDFLRLINSGYKPRAIPHLGCKFQIQENTWILSLFTSQPSINFYDIVINNIKLNNNIHKFVNQSFLINNATFSEYFVTTNNLAFGSEHLKSKNINEIVQDSIEGYRISILESNFNNPLIIIDSLYDHLSNIDAKSRTSIKNTCNNPHIKISRKIEYLRMWGIRNSDIYNFAINFENNKNIYNQSYYNHNLYYDTNEKLKHRIF
jgi:hypothetical protein